MRVIVQKSKEATASMLATPMQHRLSDGISSPTYQLGPE